MSEVGKPISVGTREDSGVQLVMVEFPTLGRQVVEFSESDLGRFLVAMQRNQLNRFEQLAEAPQFPMMKVIGSGVAHGATDTGVWVETSQSGIWGLFGSPVMLRKLRDKIDAAIKQIEARKKAN